MDRNEGIIRWSPNPTRDEFMHINLNHRIVQVYAATGQAKPGQFDFEKLSKHSEFSHLNTYDWSPTSRGLVAIGTAHGEVQLLRVDDDSNSSITLPLKLQRPCQTVAFNATGLLAVGLDRVRNDACLQIWDVNQRLADWDTKKPGFALPSAATEPMAWKRLEASVSVTSVRFFEDQPQTLVAGIKNSSVRIHDLRDPNSAVINFPTRCNNNLAIDYVDSNYVASSSLDLPGFIVWDRRATNRTVCSSVYLQAVEEDGLPFGSALNIRQGIRTGDASIKQLRFSREKPGALGILSTAGELRVCQTRKEFVEPGGINQGGPLLREIKQSHDLEWPYNDPHHPKRFEDRIVSFDWMNVGTTQLEARILALRANGQFDVLAMPAATADHLAQFTAWEPPHRLGEDHMALMKFETRAEQETNLGPLVATTLKSDIAIFGPNNYKKPEVATALNAAVKIAVHSSNQHVIELLDPTYADNLKAAGSFPVAKMEKLRVNDKSQKDRSSTSFSPTDTKSSLSSVNQHDQEHYGMLRTLPGSREQHELLDKVMLRRAKNGYLFNSKLNISLVPEDKWLQEVWRWVDLSEQATADDGMVSGPLDLSYLGVHTIWSNSLGEKARSRLIDSTVVPDSSQWERRIASINKRAGLPPFKGVETSRPHHRELCLALCGLDQPPEKFEQTLPGMLKQGLQTKAAAHALFEGAHDLAVNILKDGGTELVFVGMALEMKLNSQSFLSIDSSKWSKALSAYDLGNDAFLKAICTFITTGDWKSIVSQTSLPLRYRIGVALRTYTDSLLTTWLASEMESAIQNGSIEGILLSGITDALVDILSTYISKFQDYQTPTLLLSFCSPRYISDIRCDAWRRAYSSFLHRHKEFILRIKFERGAIQKSKSRDGMAGIKPPPRQITIRCLTCDTAATNDLANTSTISTSRLPNNPSHAHPETRNPLLSSSINAGLSCPKCGAHLARCAICMEHVGVPRSDRPWVSTDEVVKRESSFPAFCMKCKHVSHLDHANGWFARHVECPVGECGCQCNFVPVWDRGLGE